MEFSVCPLIPLFRVIYAFFFLVQTFNLTDPLFPSSSLEPLSEIHVAFPVFQSCKIETVLNESS